MTTKTMSEPGAIMEPKSNLVSYTRMADGTREDYELLRDLATPFRSALADRLLLYLETLHEGFPGDQVDRYEHSLQTATRACRGSADEETVVAALLHDIGDQLAPSNHAELSAAVLRPYVSPTTYWLVLHHGIFQGYYYFHHIGKDRYQREQYRGHPAFEKTIRFCDEWDQESFDPHYDTMPLDAFVPMLRRVFARQPWGSHTLISVA
jgi:predicted HD phosphohydrolase